VIHRTEYFQEAQDLFAQAVAQFAEEKGKALDISTTIPEAYGNFLGKMQAAVQAGNPPDMAYTSQVSIPQMHVLGLLEDVTDVVEEAKRLYGDFLPGFTGVAESQAFLDGAWRAIPFLANTTGSYMRADKLAEAGIDPASIRTLDDVREAALAISDPEGGFWGWGITPNQGGDGFSFLTLVMNNFGGSFTDESGQVVTFDSPETRAAMAWIAETYDREGRFAPMLPPGIESWTDAGNNEAYLAGSVGYTRNAFSVYAAAKRDGNPVFEQTILLPAPATQDGRSRDVVDVGGWLTIFRGAP
jgi:multiple sugar transport system substrate-binding protein